MHLEILPIHALSAWMNLNGVELYGVSIVSLPGGRGFGLILNNGGHARDPQNSVLMKIPNDLILSLENVWIYAKADHHLREVLEAVGEFARTARGAILIFLLMQMTRNAMGGHASIGVSNAFTEYVRFLPRQIPLPTFWSEEERDILAGTSLQAAVDAKLVSLDREFALLQDKTASIKWCQEVWWHQETGAISIGDWKQVDAAYRSRALEMPSVGHAMVPCIDMANHASGDHTVALYEVDPHGDAVLVLRDDMTVEEGDEVTITYGDTKGACEMLFSYGFIEDTMTSAQELFLDLDVPDDDPLKSAKKAVSKSAPGFRLFMDGQSTNWEGQFVWLQCINEEDGLEFQLAQNLNGEKKLTVAWKSTPLENLSNIESLLRDETSWDVFLLRATVVVQTRLERQLLALEASNFLVGEVLSNQENERVRQACRLRDLEETLMLQAYEELEEQKFQLAQSPVVQEYLGSTEKCQTSVMPINEDFS